MIKYILYDISGEPTLTTTKLPTDLNDVSIVERNTYDDDTDELISSRVIYNKDWEEPDIVDNPQPNITPTTTPTNKKKRYIFKGGVCDISGKCISNNMELETRAVSKPQAVNYIKGQIKKKLGRNYDTQIQINDSDVKEVEQENINMKNVRLSLTEKKRKLRLGNETVTRPMGWHSQLSPGGSSEGMSGGSSSGSSGGGCCEALTEDNSPKKYEVCFYVPNTDIKYRTFVYANSSEEAMEMGYKMPQSKSRDYTDMYVREYSEEPCSYGCQLIAQDYWNGKPRSGRTEEYVFFKANNESQVRRYVNNNLIGKYYRGYQFRLDTGWLSDKPKAEGQCGKFVRIADIYQCGSDGGKDITNESLTEKKKCQESILVNPDIRAVWRSVQNDMPVTKIGAPVGKYSDGTMALIGDCVYNKGRDRYSIIVACRGVAPAPQYVLLSDKDYKESDGEINTYSEGWKKLELQYRNAISTPVSEDVVSEAITEKKKKRIDINNGDPAYNAKRFNHMMGSGEYPDPIQGSGSAKSITGQGEADGGIGAVGNAGGGCGMCASYDRGSNRPSLNESDSFNCIDCDYDDSGKPWSEVKKSLIKKYEDKGYTNVVVKRERSDTRGLKMYMVYGDKKLDEAYLDRGQTEECRNYIAHTCYLPSNMVQIFPNGRFEIHNVDSNTAAGVFNRLMNDDRISDVHKMDSSWDFGKFNNQTLTMGVRRQSISGMIEPNTSDLDEELFENHFDAQRFTEDFYFHNGGSLNENDNLTVDSLLPYLKGRDFAGNKEFIVSKIRHADSLQDIQTIANAIVKSGISKENMLRDKGWQQVALYLSDKCKNLLIDMIIKSPSAKTADHEITLATKRREYTEFFQELQKIGNAANDMHTKRCLNDANYKEVVKAYNDKYKALSKEWSQPSAPTGSATKVAQPKKPIKKPTPQRKSKNLFSDM